MVGDFNLFNGMHVFSAPSFQSPKPQGFSRAQSQTLLQSPSAWRCTLS